MNGQDIITFLHKVPQFGGVLGADQISQARQKKMYVINTEPVRLPGLHWTVIDLTGKEPYFFDSFGHSPQFYHFKIQPKGKHNTFVLQHSSSETCGIWSIYYIIYKSKKYSVKRMLSKFSTKDRKRNDAYIIKWLTKLPQKKTL